MLYQIAVSVVLLILAFTTLPRLQAEPEQSGTRQEAIVPQQAPLLRSIDPDKPKVIDVRAIDPSLNEMAQWVSANFDLPYSSQPPRVERVPAADLHRLRYKKSAAVAIAGHRRRAFHTPSAIPARSRGHLR